VIRAFMRENLEKNPLNEDEKYVFVFHSRMIATLTASGLDETGKIKDFDWYNNCEVKPFFNF